MSTLITRRYSDYKFGGILYLQQRGQKQPMLTELLGNDVLKENLFQVVTILGPHRDSSEQGELCFQNAREISQRKDSAWAIIDEVYQKVERNNLTVGVVQLALETIWKSLVSKKSNGRGRSWPFSFKIRSFKF